MELWSSEGSTGGGRLVSASKFTHMVTDRSHFLAGHRLETSVPCHMGLSLVYMTWQLVSATVNDQRKKEPNTGAAVFYNVIASEVVNLHFCHSLPAAVLVSYCCYNRLPQTRWLKATPIYYLTVLENRSLKWAGSAVSLLEAQGRIYFLFFSRL